MEQLPPEQFRDVLDQARTVWGTNDRGDYLAPHPKNYPHQWLWDSAAHAAGMRHLDVTRAAREVESIFVGQRDSGMIPNVRFVDDSLRSNFEAWLWGNRFDNYDGPRGIKTSGITQPPIVAEAMWQVGEKMDHETRQQFLGELFDPLVRYHRWIYDARTPANDGLFAAIHPWETGQDNKLPLMKHSRSLDWGGIVSHAAAWSSQVLRPDLRNTSISERSTFSEGVQQALALLSLRHCRFDQARIRAEHPLHYQDEGMNALLIRNNTMLRQIASEIDRSLPDDLLESMQRTETNLELLWSEDDGTYYPRDALTGEHIPVQTLSSLLPLCSGVLPPDREQILYDDMKNPDKFWSPYGIPNLPFDNPERRENGYWHETWVITNWFIVHALERAGKKHDADTLTRNSLMTLRESGMHEYFNARSGAGLGVRGFGWTALLAIDLAQQLKNS